MMFIRSFGIGERFAMMRKTSGLPRSVGKWVSQVSASAGATLVAMMVYGALSKAAGPAPPAPRPEMTSGGKFAARVAHASSEAYDGLDTMPLPHLAAPAPAPAAPAAFLLAPVPAGMAEPADAAQPVASGQPPLSGQPLSTGRVHQAAWDGAIVLKSARSAARSEARPAAAPSAPVSRVPTGDSGAMAMPAPDLTQGADGLLAGAMSTARNAWDVTASASGALVSRLTTLTP